MLRRSLLSLYLAAAVWMFAASASAAPLNLTLEPTPDILLGTLDLVYDSTTDTLSSSGFSLALDGVNLDTIGNLSLSATVDDSGTLSAGSFSITGEIGAFNSGTLLTGSLTDFGFDATGSLFEFTFDVTGGDLAGAYGGAPGGIILATDLRGFTGFGSDFDNNFDAGGFGAGTADVAPIPEPGTAFLMMTGLALLAGSKRSH